MLLTKVEPYAENKKFILHFENGDSLRCGTGELADFCLRAGMELDDEQYSRLCAACAYFLVRNKAAQLIAMRAMSAGELIKKLTEKGAEREYAERATQWLGDMGVIDEAEYAKMTVRHYSAKGYGKARVINELYRRMIPRKYWEEALDELPETDDKIDAFIDSKLRGLPCDERERKRVCDALIRRGYSWDEVRRAMGRYEDKILEQQD